MRYLTVLFLFLAFVDLASQEASITDTVAKSLPLGRMSWLEWQQKAGWASYDAGDYNIPFDFIKSLRQRMEGREITFVIFGASWCPDVREGLPQIIKLFALLPVGEDRIELYGVDRDKLDPGNVALTYSLKKVPTLIVLEGGKEIGRIVEFPLLSWYEDLLDILKK